MVAKRMLGRAVVSLGLVLATCASPVAAQTGKKAGDHFWKLGAGLYWSAGVLPEVDEARWDWLLVTYPNADWIAHLNRLQQINPRQKYLMRLLPLNGLGHPKYDLGCACMFDYLYKPGVKQAILKRIREQVAICMTLKNRDKIVGFTFGEEMPGWWGLGSLVSWQEDATQVPERLELYRKSIEKDRGKRLVMDHETRLWIGRTYAETLEEIHREMKKAAPGKMVLYWHHSGYGTLDELPAGAPPVGQGIYPFRFGDIVKPGVCDGLMAYPNRQDRFEVRFLPFIRKAKCPYFTQLSHPSCMRLSSWPDAITMAKTKDPWNMGYFLFCSGRCKAKQWNDDPNTPDDENVLYGSARRHLRRIATRQQVGMDVVRRYFRPEIQIDFALDKMKPGRVATVTAVVRNPKDPSYYPDPAEAVARDAKVAIAFPKGWRVDPRYSVPAMVPLGDLPPGDFRAVTWYIEPGPRKAITPATPVCVTATARDMPTGKLAVHADTQVPGFAVHEVCESGLSWHEPGYRIASDRPYVTLEGLATPVRSATLTDGVRTVTYKGELWAGLRLVVTPKGSARLYATNLVPTMATVPDKNDPTGFRAWTEGYGVAAVAVSKYVRGGLKYRVSIPGKATGGANSMVIVRCRTADNKVKSFPCLGNRFTDKWAETAADLAIPPEVTLIERVYLYRLNKKGTIWYGQPAIRRADIPAEGRDVTGELAGLPIRLSPGAITVVTYTDENPVSATPYVRVQVSREAPQRGGLGSRL